MEARAIPRTEQVQDAGRETAIAAESGVDDFLAQATPEAKLRLIREEQAQGKGP